MRVWTWPRTIGVFLVSATGLIGALHLPFARPLLACVAGCPVARVTPEQVEQAQRRALQKLRGSDVAPARPALGFMLDATTLDDVKAWARKNGLTCDESRKGALLKCEDVPARAFTVEVDGAVDEIAFGFRLHDHVLMNLTTLQTGIDAATAVSRFTQIADRLSRALGPAKMTRRPDDAWDGSRPAYVSYRFTDYLAEASAMRLPDRGVMLREHYVSALDITPSPSTTANHVNGTF